MTRVVLHLPGCRSLKEKRQIVKSLIAQVQRQFQLAVAEVERQDQWQIAVVGLAYVSNDAGHADQVLSRAVAFLSSRRLDADVLEYETETLHAL